MEAGIFLTRQHKCVMSIPLKYRDLDPISLSSCAIPGTHFDILGPVDVSDENDLLKGSIGLAPDLLLSGFLFSFSVSSLPYYHNHPPQRCLNIRCFTSVIVGVNMQRSRHGLTLDYVMSLLHS